MQDTPKGNRLHIAIFGARNAGKSSLINALTNQNIALVSNVPGTTTDPVYKAMEILPVGPVVIIDTAGIDDEGELGKLRVERTIQVLNKTDIALLVIDACKGITDFETELVQTIKNKKIPLIGVVNKTDLQDYSEEKRKYWSKQAEIPLLAVSAAAKKGMEDLKRAIIKAAPEDWEGPGIIGDLIHSGDMIMLVVPIDSAAPKGRLILPQVQTIRDILDNDAACIVVKEHQLKQALNSMKRSPRLVVTDSQVFGQVAKIIPDDVMLTSFSILFARHRGDLETFVEGAHSIASLKPGDKVLIVEGCTHHRQSDDIGQVKIPRWLCNAVGGELHFKWVSGGEFPRDLQQYKLIVHCGSCMLNRREVLYRLSVAREQRVPIVNYGVLIASLHGILPRVLSPFPSISKILAENGGL